MRALSHGTIAFIAIIGVVLAAGLPASGAENPFAEVPEGHWAYASLAEFASLGLIEGYSEDAFSGAPPITRYEMAWAVSRLVDGLRGTPGSAAPQASLSIKQRETISRLQEEFRNEIALVAVAGRQGLEEAIAARGGNPASGATPSTGTGSLSPLRLTELLGSAPFAASNASSAAAGASLSLEPDIGVAAAVSALPSDLGSRAISGGRRLSELIGVSQVTSAQPALPGAGAAAGAGMSTSTSTSAGAGAGARAGAATEQRKAALTIPLEGGAEAELSLGGPSMAGAIAPDEGEDVIARLDLKYALSQLAIFRAGYELVKDGESGSDGSEGNAARATALLGIDYNFALSDSASIRAGYTYSRITDLVPQGVTWSTPGAAGGSGERTGKSAGVFGDYTLPGLSLDARKTTASLGVSYTFGDIASVILGYRLIDFQELNADLQLSGLRRTNVATAELSIRF